MNKPNSEYRAASRCTGGACIEIAMPGDVVLVRDGKDRTGEVLAFGNDAWVSFLDAVKAGMIAFSDGR